MNLPGDKLSIENAWMRNSLKGMNTALFCEVVNKGIEADTLYKVASDLAELVQIHETYKEGDMMGMREVDKIVIEPNSTFKFKPGAHHIMLIKLKKDLKNGDKGDVILFFRKAGEIKLKVPVKKMVMN
jgi:hypothetical protein